MFTQRRFDSVGVILQGPGQRAWISQLGETHAVAQSCPKAPDQSPVSVQPRQINQRGERRASISADVHLFFHHLQTYYKNPCKTRMFEMDEKWSGDESQALSAIEGGAGS